MSIRENALYPPLHAHGPRVGEAQLHAAMTRSNNDPIPRPIALAISLPGGRSPAMDGDFARLHREIDGIARRIDRDRAMVELVVDASSVEAPLRSLPLRELLSAIDRQLYAAPYAVRTVLAEAPCHPLEAEDIGVLRAAGFDRLAVAGARIRPDILRTARLCGFRSTAVTIDCAGPADTGFAIRQAADAAISLRPDRLEIRAKSESPALGHAFAEAIRTCTESAGYSFVGPEQFALTGDDLAIAARAGRTRFGVFGYTAVENCDLLGAGPGAVSQVGNCLVRNATDLPAWRLAIDAGRLTAQQGILLSEEDRIRDAVIQSLLCRRLIPIRDLEAEFHFTFRRRFALELTELARQRGSAHLRDNGDRIEVRSPGWPWLRNMAACFDLYASRSAPIQEAGIGR